MNLDKKSRNLFAVCFDLNNVLDKGSEESLTHAINMTLEEVGIDRRVEVEDVLALYGNPLDTFVEAFFPKGLDVSKIAQRIVENDQTIFKNHVRPREGAREVIEQIKSMGGFVYIVSAVEWGSKGIFDYLHHLGMDNQAFIPYSAFRRERGMILAIYKHVNPSSPVPDYISDDVTGFKTNAISSFLYPKYFNRGYVVGDTKVDMEAAKRADEFFRKQHERAIQYGTGNLFPYKPVYGILFDPLDRNAHIQADYRIRDLREIPSIIVSTSSKQQ